MKIMSRIHFKGKLLLALGLLALILVLGGCGHASAVNNGGSTGSGYSTGLQSHGQGNPSNTTGSSSNTGSSSDVQSIDTQIQGSMQGLGGAKNDVGSSDSGSSQDNGQQP